MKLRFEIKVNHDYIRINTLKVILKDGGVLYLDREQTNYMKTTANEYTMYWDNCYLWTLNGRNIFGQEGTQITDDYSIDEFEKLIEGAKFEFFLEEDDVDEDYKVDILDVRIEKAYSLY